MSSGELGLRERKRLATRRSLQLAALTTTYRLGLVGATVDEISRVAGVSPRTFFNHFSSKEEALLGEETLPLDSSAIREFVTSRRGRLVPDIGALLASVIKVDRLDRELVRQRRRLAEKYPELASGRARWMDQLQTDLTRAIEDRLGHEAPELSATVRAEQAQHLAFASIAVFRSAWHWWTDHGSDDSLMGDIERAFESFTWSGGRRFADRAPDRGRSDHSIPSSSST